MKLKDKGDADISSIVKSASQDLYDDKGNAQHHDTGNVVQAHMSYNYLDLSISIPGGSILHERVTFNHANNHVQVNNEVNAIEVDSSGNHKNMGGDASTSIGDDFIELDFVNHHAKQQITLDMGAPCKALPHSICATSISEFDI